MFTFNGISYLTEEEKNSGRYALDPNGVWVVAKNPPFNTQGKIYWVEDFKQGMRPQPDKDAAVAETKKKPENCMEAAMDRTGQVDGMNAQRYMNMQSQKMLNEAGAVFEVSFGVEAVLPVGALAQDIASKVAGLFGKELPAPEFHVGELKDGQTYFKVTKEVEKKGITFKSAGGVNVVNSACVLVGVGVKAALYNLSGSGKGEAPSGNDFDATEAAREKAILDPPPPEGD